MSRRTSPRTATSAIDIPEVKKPNNPKLTPHRKLSPPSPTQNDLKIQPSQENQNITIISHISSVAQLMRIPINFINVQTQALIDTGAAASFLAHRLLIQIPFKNITVIEQDSNTLQYFKTVSGEIVKPIGRFELRIKLAKDHPFTHTFYVVSDLDEGCILGYDFLANHGISVNPSKRSITYTQNNEQKTLTIVVWSMTTVNDHAIESGRYAGQPVVHPATARI